MYRQASQLSRAKNFLPSPAPDELSDSDSDLISILESKRREIDDAIEAFKSLKEKEFRTFEDEFRSRKRRNQNIGLLQPISQPISPISGLSGLSKKDFDANGSAARDKKKKADYVNLIGQKPTPGPSKPVVSVTNNGMTTPPISSTPPLGRNVFPSPTHQPGTPPRTSSEKETGKSPKLPMRENEFHGLFTPGYLQLLETNPSSLPQNSTSPSTMHSRPALTAPPLPSNSLPSALRTASGTVRKRKHVTFRLAHSVVVDPSSSYEEIPSPSDDQYGKDLDDSETGWGDELPPSSLPIQIPRVDSYESLASPNKTDNEASFFAFDEELDDTSDKPPDDQNDLEGDFLELDDTEQQAEPFEVDSPTFSSGSLPINIVNPSSSFREALSS